MKKIQKLKNSEYVLEKIKDCINENKKTFEGSKSGTGKPNTHSQNLLRGTILLSCAGLDAFLKQIIKDCLVAVEAKNEKSKKYFKKKIERQILYKNGKESNKWKNYFFDDGAAFIAESLLSGNPREFVEKYVINELLKDSKQSYNQLCEITEAFGISVDILTTKKKEIQDLFKIRNEISHEFDIRFHNKQGKANRNERSGSAVFSNAELTYEIAESFYKSIRSELV